MKKHIVLLLSNAFIYAGSVDSKFFYQDYLDFANNKGKFQVNDSFSIFSIDKSKEIKIEKMIDFSVNNKSGLLLGEFANVGGSYSATAAHMIGDDYIKKGSYLEFGGVRNIVISSSNNLANYWGQGNHGAFNDNLRDFVILRTNKLNINNAASLINKDFFAKDSSAREGYKYLNNVNELLKDKRYSLIVRAGTGYQGINKASENEEVALYTKYFTGGILDSLSDFVSTWYDGELYHNAYDNKTNSYKDFNISAASGDSGSALYIYDNVDKKYYLLAVASYVTNGCYTSNDSYKCTGTHYSLVNNDLVNDFINKNTQKSDLNSFTFENNLFKDTQNNTLANNITSKDAVRLDDLAKSKDYYFSKDANLTLKQDFDLGASALYFADNTKNTISGNYNFINAGVVVGKNSSLDYYAKTQSKDALVKMGEGLLNIKNSSSTGKLRIGDGSVVFENNDNFYTFGSIYAINGANIKITKNTQINPTYLYFATNGANLDLNAQKVDFHALNANDEKAHIYSSANTSTINILPLTTLDTTRFYHGSFGKNLDINIKSSYIFDGNFDVNNVSIDNKNVSFQGSLLTHNYIKNLKNPSALEGQNYYINPIERKDNSINEDEFINRNFNINKLSLSNNAELNLASDVSLNAKEIILQNSSLNAGKTSIELDLKQGENISSSQACGSKYTKDCTYDEYYAEFKYEENKKEFKITPKNININSNISLENSKLNFLNTNFYGSINDINNSTLDTTNSIINANVNVANLISKDSIFNLNLEKNEQIKASNSANILTTKVNFSNINFTSTLDKILLVSLKNAQNTNENLLSFNEIKEAFSILKPNIVYENKDNVSNWYLASIKDEILPEEKPNLPETKPEEKPSLPTEPSIPNTPNEPNVPNIPNEPSLPEEKPSLPETKPEEKPSIPEENIPDTPSFKQYFTSTKNTPAITSASNALDSAFTSFVLEWNNLFKRLGEVRYLNEYDNALWAKYYVGESRYLHSFKTNFYEIQLGADKKVSFNDIDFLSGIMLSKSYYKLDNKDYIKGNIDGYSLGFYASYLFNNDFFIDAVLKYFKYKNDFSILLANNDNKIQLFANNSYANLIYSLEFGKRFSFENYYLEPIIELIGARIAKQEIKKDNIKITQEAFNALSLKSALYFAFLDDDKYLRFGSGINADLLNAGKKILKDYHTQNNPIVLNSKKDKRLFINLSAGYKLSLKQVINLEFEKSFLGDLNTNYSFNLTYRYSF